MGDEEEEGEREREQIELSGESWIFSSRFITQLAVGLFEMDVFETGASYVKSVMSDLCISNKLLGCITNLPVVLSYSAQCPGKNLP